MGKYSLEEMDFRQKEFVNSDREEAQFVVRKYKGQWYGVDNSVSVGHNLDVPFQGVLLMIDEDNGEIEQKDSLVDIVDYMTNELGAVEPSQAPEEFRDRMDDLRQ